MVARPYLRTPRPVIIQTTTLARRKRHEFVRAVSKGLIPPETPPTLRKVRKRRFPGLMAMDPVDDVSIGGHTKNQHSCLYLHSLALMDGLYTF